MELRPYQIVGRDFLASRRLAYLADEMRVGKTPQAILAAHKRGARTINIVCPAIARPHWHREMQAWWPGEILPKYEVLSYNQAVQYVRDTPRADVFILDEAHFAKTPSAARSLATLGKGGFAWRAGATWCLSGTPAPNHAGELWTVLSAFGLVGCSYMEFVRQYCRCSYEPFTIHGTNTAHIPYLKKLMEGFFLRRTRKEVAPDMPGIDFEFLPLEVIHTTSVPQMPIDADASWLEKHATSYVTARRLAAMGKAPMLAEQINDDMEQIKRAVVFGYFREPMEVLAAQLRGDGRRVGIIDGYTPPRKRERYQQEFRDGEIEILVAQIIAAGTAIDLSSASHGYFLDLDWVPGNNLQAANRLVSMDKHEPVTFDIAVWQGSPDEHVNKTLRRKVRELSTLF